MSYHGPYTSRVTSRRRAYTGPVRAGPRRSKLAFIATIVAIGFVAAAIAYDVAGTSQKHRDWSAASSNRGFTSEHAALRATPRAFRSTSAKMQIWRFGASHALTQI